ncbi:MAG: metal ABC transporter substrate-binding protein, partial [Omnitrophica WOR_2 bacterium]
MLRRSFSFILTFLFLLSACQPAGSKTGNPGDIPKVLAAETFLADIAQNVAGERLQVGSLIPPGVDPHTFEPAPADVVKVAQSDILIVNGAGLESFLTRLLQNAGGKHAVIEASKGLTSRKPSGSETAQEIDPHFYLDPVNVIQYVNNIRDGLSQADPAGTSLYTQNADAYILKLKSLDQWIRSQVDQIPPGRRLLVTNHESFGYFADRYGFKIVGAIIPSVTPDASPSAQELAALVNQIKAAGAPAIFLEKGTNQQLAQQV